MPRPTLHEVPHTAPPPRPSLLEQIKDNALLLGLVGVIVGMAVAFYFNDRTYLTDAVKEVTNAVGRMQAGVNQALTNQAIADQRARDLMERVNRDAEWNRAQITEIQRKLP